MPAACVVGRAEPAEAGTFRSQQEIVFGVGAEECGLEDLNFQFFLHLLTAIRETRHSYGPPQQPLFRLHPERWLESLVVGDASVMDERLESASLYSQVPAFFASDRALLDGLRVTREGRLAVVELKADEDMKAAPAGCRLLVKSSVAPRA
jgi:hypothetical protein